MQEASRQGNGVCKGPAVGLCLCVRGKSNKAGVTEAEKNGAGEAQAEGQEAKEGLWITLIESRTPTARVLEGSGSHPPGPRAEPADSARH